MPLSLERIGAVKHEQFLDNMPLEALLWKQLYLKK
jgi:hypothetical protein